LINLINPTYSDQDSSQIMSINKCKKEVSETVPLTIPETDAENGIKKVLNNG